jgi:hypothetical protein
VIEFTAVPWRPVDNAAMSELRTIWDDMAERRAAPTRKPIPGYVLVAVLLVTMTVAEVQFLRFVASPDTVNMITAAEGVPPTN